VAVTCRPKRRDTADLLLRRKPLFPRLRSVPIRMPLLLTHSGKNGRRPRNFLMGLLSTFFGDKKGIGVVAELTVAERECCRFSIFVSTAQPNRGPASVHVTGPAGTKDFLKTILPCSKNGG
jgi:hypothetical protein